MSGITSDGIKYVLKPACGGMCGLGNLEKWIEAPKMSAHTYSNVYCFKCALRDQVLATSHPCFWLTGQDYLVYCRRDLGTGVIVRRLVNSDEVHDLLDKEVKKIYALFRLHCATSATAIEDALEGAIEKKEEKMAKIMVQAKEEESNGDDEVKKKAPKKKDEKKQKNEKKKAPKKQKEEKKKKNKDEKKNDQVNSIKNMSSTSPKTKKTARKAVANMVNLELVAGTIENKQALIRHNMWMREQQRLASSDPRFSK